jgi:ribosomal-protein-alanine N-acetyltransferase
MKNPFLIGPRLYFRPLEREDASRVAGFLNDPSVRNNLLAHRPLSVQHELERLEQLGKDEQQVVLGISRHGETELIGSTGLHHLSFRSRTAELGLLIGEHAFWGQGYGTEATRMMLDYGFGTLNLNKVWLQVYAHNRSGIRVYEKAGFKQEGIQREQHFTEGRYVDTVLMGILRSEWKPLSSPPAERAPAKE